MGAGCTLSNKNVLNAEVLKPEKKIKIKPQNQEENHISNVHDQTQNSASIHQNQNQNPNPVSLDLSPKYEENEIKNYRIGQYLITNEIQPSFWKNLLHKKENSHETFPFLFEFFKKHQEIFFQKVQNVGPCQGHRWESWTLMFRINKQLNDQTNEKSFYELLLTNNSPHEEDIKKDIFRTFPTHPYFIESSPENTLLSISPKMGNLKLFRILKAISVYYPEMGYCQGMNFVIAFLLAVSGGKECEVFQLFIKLAENPKFRILGFYENGFPLMKLYSFIFYQLLEKRYNKLAKHLKKIDLPETLWLTKWLMTMLIYSFPLEISVRLWDYIIASKSLFTLIKVCLELLRSMSKKLFEKDAMGIAEFFREIIENKEILIHPKSEIYINPDKVIQKAKKIKFSEKTIAKWTNAFIETLEKDEEKKNAHLLFYKDWGKKL